MNILTLNPPFHAKFSRSQRSPAVIKSGVMYYPIWLAYTTGVLEKDGFTVKLVDAPAAGVGLPELLELIEDFLPRLLVVDTSTPSISNDLEVVAEVKAKHPGIFAVLVGPHVTALPDETLQASAAVDAVARGEYDYTIRDLARCLDGGGDLSSVLGLSYKDKDGQIVKNLPRPLIKDLDELPFVSEVYKRHLDIRNYFYSITRYPEVAIITGRGCPYECTYCIWPQTITGHGYRRRSVENVADEFEFIARELPEVKEIFIEDDTLTVNQKRSVALAEELIRRGNRLPFTANSRADVSYDTLLSLRKAGLRLVCVGFESGDQQILDAIKKKITLDQFYEFRQAARQAKVLVHGCFMAGNPGETRQTLQKTLELSKKLNPDTAQFFPLMLYPGSEAYEWARRNNYLSTENYSEWLTPDGLHKSIVSYPEFTGEDLVEWCDTARRSFYLRPRYIINKLWEMVTRPGEITRILKAFRTFFRYLFRPSLEKGGPAAVDNPARPE
jgi:anaerobic magnesium-protoporphyrin IX monomethyl ester cyclase